MKPPSKRPAYANRYAKLHRAGYRVSTDPRGSMRRLQALMAMGHPRAVIAEKTGLSYNYLYEMTRGTETRVKKQTAALIAAVYDELHMIRRDDTTGKRVRGYAIRHKYAPPLAWDDIDTDVRPHMRSKAA